MTRVATGRDLQSSALGDPAGFTGTSTAVGATSLTHSGAGWTTDEWKGHIVSTGGVIAVVLSNTAAVLTIDRWTTPSRTGGSAGATPSTGAYNIIPGAAPASWMALSATGGATNDSDTTLSGEVASGTLARTQAVYAHTAGGSTYTHTVTYTSDQTITPAAAGMFPAQNGGRMMFRTLIPTPPGLISGDQLTVTDTVSI